MTRPSDLLRNSAARAGYRLDTYRSKLARSLASCSVICLAVAIFGSYYLIDGPQHRTATRVGVVLVFSPRHFLKTLAVPHTAPDSVVHDVETILQGVALDAPIEDGNRKHPTR